MSKILKCHPGIGDKTEGIVLCAKDNFSARYDLDRVKGLFSRPQHKLFGKSYKNKILVLNESKGGVASAWMLYEMKVRDMVPKAILFNKANNGINPTPCSFNFILSHKQSLIASYYIHQKPFVSIRYFIFKSVRK